MRKYILTERETAISLEFLETGKKLRARHVWGSEHLLRDVWPYAEELGEHVYSYGDLFVSNVLISNNSTRAYKEVVIE